MDGHLPPNSTVTRQILAWGVHLYTALGLVLAAKIAMLIVEGTHEAFCFAFFLMIAACAIDATDGALARLVKVKKVLPWFDGSKLDDLTDFLTYTFLPLLLMWRAGTLDRNFNWTLLVALVASAYGFCQELAKTPDGYFLGFPSYWNIVAFYLYVLAPPAWIAGSLVLLLAGLTFVPSYYLYPSQRGSLNRFTSLLGILWAGLLGQVLWRLWIVPLESDRAMDELRRLTLWSLAFPAYYFVASWVITWRRWRGNRSLAGTRS